ncbi:MAG: transposase [Gammaproteobacteria bacterium]|nr:transposase [Gammaproteobacteria bacterium]
MTIARSQQISLDHTPYYHCTTRCVRRAFLCGEDRYSGKNFDHRRQWIEKRLIDLSRVFAIDLLAYAVMSNHYHVVVRINTEKADSWDDADIIERWGRIYSLPEGDVRRADIDLWRSRLANLSWYMRCINENLARRANREDRCTGRFWEGRFKSQALLDEAALIKCMAYVDLNPIRAKTARTPESSAHTSIRSRIAGVSGHLAPFVSNHNARTQPVPIRYADYLRLLDHTGRALRCGAREVVPAHLVPILESLGVEPTGWLREMQNYGRWYYRAVGPMQLMRSYCEHLGRKWLKGTGRVLTCTE